MYHNKLSNYNMKTIIRALVLIGGAVVFLRSGLPAPDPGGQVAVQQLKARYQGKLPQTNMLADPSGTVLFEQVKSGITLP